MQLNVLSSIEKSERLVQPDAHFFAWWMYWVELCCILKQWTVIQAQYYSNTAQYYKRT